MKTCAIVGINWGDEGKGRMVDLIAKDYDVVVRYQGGSNAGHTVINEYGKFALNLIPSGIFRPKVINILGNGTVIDLEHLSMETEKLRKAGVQITSDNLKISDRAMIVLPYHKVLDELAGRAIFAAQLLAGEMPAEIEDVFTAAGVSLFPDRLTDLRTDCTCPDYANPCKHVAAVHYILGDRFDEDPFLILRLRGRTQDLILSGLRARRGVDAPVDRGTIIDIGDNVPTLEEELPTFWEMDRDLHGFSVHVSPPIIPLPLLKRLGEPEVRAPITLQGQLEEVYEAVSQAALSLAYGDFGAPPTNGTEE